MASVPKPEPGHFNVLYFAGASSFTGKEHESLTAPLSIKSLFAELESRYPGISATILSSCMVTINLAYVDVPDPDGASDGEVIQVGDEVAIIPPVSSG